MIARLSRRNAPQRRGAPSTNRRPHLAYAYEQEVFGHPVMLARLSRRNVPQRRGAPSTHRRPYHAFAYKGSRCSLFHYFPATLLNCLQPQPVNGAPKNTNSP
jgi:hypothetical protein